LIVYLYLFYCIVFCKLIIVFKTVIEIKKMFKKLVLIGLIFSACNFEAPTEFTELALNNDLISMQHKKIPLKEILKKHKGKKILINIWASWCGDCIVGIPKLKELQTNYPDVEYVFISTDRNLFSWKKAIDKYKIKGSHYFLKKGLDTDLGDFLNSNWIPRYLVVNENGFVDLFKAKKITDPRIVEAIKK